MYNPLSDLSFLVNAGQVFLAKYSLYHIAYFFPYNNISGLCSQINGSICIYLDAEMGVKHKF